MRNITYIILSTDSMFFFLKLNHQQAKSGHQTTYTMGNIYANLGVLFLQPSSKLRETSESHSLLCSLCYSHRRESIGSSSSTVHVHRKPPIFCCLTENNPPPDNRRSQTQSRPPQLPELFFCSPKYPKSARMGVSRAAWARIKANCRRRRRIIVNVCCVDSVQLVVHRLC